MLRVYPQLCASIGKLIGIGKTFQARASCNHIFHSQEIPLRTSRNSWMTGTVIVGLAATALVGCGGNSGDNSLPVVSDNIAINPAMTCSMQGIGSTPLTADAPVSVLEVSSGTTGAGASDKAYCLVKVKVDPADPNKMVLWG